VTATALTIISGFVLIIIVIFVCFQLTKSHRVRVKVDWKSLGLEIERPPAAQKRVPSRRSTRQRRRRKATQ
jgi:hypothetical protein